MRIEVTGETHIRALDPLYNFFTIGTLPDLNFRFVLARNTAIANEIAARFDATPDVEALMGKAMLGAFFLCTHAAKQKNTVSLHFECEGPVRRLIAFAGSDGALRAMAAEPHARWDGPIEAGKGAGVLRVNRWNESGKLLYSSAVEFRDAGIDRNVEEFIGRSEQIQTFLRLETSRGAERLDQVSGYMFQALPGATADHVDAVLAMIGDKSPGQLITAMLAGDAFGGRMRPMEGGMESVSVLKNGSFRSYCDCSRHKVERILVIMGREAVLAMAAERGEVEVICEFCKRTYTLSPEEASGLFKDA